MSRPFYGFNKPKAKQRTLYQCQKDGCKYLSKSRIKYCPEHKIGY